MNDVPGNAPASRTPEDRSTQFVPVEGGQRRHECGGICWSQPTYLMWAALIEVPLVDVGVVRTGLKRASRCSTRVCGGPRRKPDVVPPIEHIIYIPGVLLIGIVLGYTMGARAVRAEIDRLKKRAKR